MGFAISSDARLNAIVEWQLGRRPGIPFRVQVNCCFGYPAVLLNQTSDAGGNPNPNLYYLCCPYLRRGLARLEGAGLAQRLTRQVKAEPEVARALAEAQHNFQAEWTRQAASDRRKNPGPAPRISAAASDMSIKCLHAHFAYFLVHPGYLLGKIILAELPDEWCPDERCQVSLEQNSIAANG